MSKHEPKARRLTAIMFSDIVGYTALMAENEEVGLRVRVRHRDLLGPLAQRYRGAVVDENGDELVLSFSSAVNAVNCALATQEALHDDPELKLKIGIHLGDVIFEGGRVYGDGVNVASRVRPLAEPGGICISDEVQRSVRNQPNVETHVLGTRELKNVPSPVTLYQVTGAAAAPQSAAPHSPTVKPHALDWRAGAAVVIALVALAVAFLVVDNYVLEAEPEQAEVVAEQVPAVEAVVREKSIAVLPFVNMSSDPEQEFFSDGISEELLNTLAHFEGLRVVGRTSSFSFKNSDADLTEIGNALGADVILEGSVRKAGNRVRITTQLVDAENGLQRWSETYDRELDDIFAIQTEIATAIADALRVSLSSEEHERLAASPTENLEAYQAYLLGRQRLAKGTTASVEEAIEYFQQAIELDPKLALAYVGLTLSYLAQATDTGRPLDEMLARAQAAADKALALDDRLAEAHVALGEVDWMANDIEAAEAAFQRALALNPNSVMAYLSYARLLGFELARYDEALALTRKAVELDPLSLEATLQLAEHLNMLGRIDEALSWYERVLEIDPDNAYGYTQIGIHHRYVSGRIDEAVVWLTKALALDPRSQFNLAVLVWQFLDLGDPDRAEYWSNRCMELGSEGYWPNVVMQMLAVYRGDEAAALEHGRKALALGPYDVNEVLMFLRNREVRAGRYIEARALYEEHFPELLYERDPRVDLRNYRAAIDLALILSRTGEQEQADLLLNRSLQQIQRRPRFGRRGYDITDVQIYALQGEKQKALSALRDAIDEGWRAEWWMWFRKPDLDSLHDEPEFQAMVAEIEADMAAQLARVREMERNGELEVIPEVSATTP